MVKVPHPATVALLLAGTWAGAAEQFAPAPARLAAPDGAPVTFARQMAPGDLLIKLVASHTAFTARLTSTSSVNGSLATQISTVAFDRGKMRVATESASAAVGGVSPAAVEKLRAQGLVNMVSVMDPGKNTGYLIFPEAKAYCEVPAALWDWYVPAGELHVATREAGTETVDGHPTVLHHHTLTTAQGFKQDVVTWNATDLDRFPIRISVRENGQARTMAFSDIRFDPPLPDAFVPPVNFTRYPDVQQLLQAAVQRAQTGAGTVPAQTVGIAGGPAQRGGPALPAGPGLPSAPGTPGGPVQSTAPGIPGGPGRRGGPGVPGRMDIAGERGSHQVNSTTPLLGQSAASTP